VEKNNKKKKKSNTEVIPFDVSKMSALKYMKIIFIDANKKLNEIQADANKITNDVIQLYINENEEINLTCPVGVVLKLVTYDAIYFAKTILTDIHKVNGKYMLITEIPKKTIRQQNREFYRIDLSRPFVFASENDKNNNQVYIAQSVNISKGGVLLNNLESISNEDQVRLKLSGGDCCHIAMFLEKDLKIKSYAKFIRAELVGDSYRCAFQFLNMPQKYIVPFDNYLKNEEYKLLRSIKTN